MYGQAEHIHSAADAVIDLSTMIDSGAGSVKKNSCLFWFFNKDDFVTSIKTAFEELWNWLINKISFGDKKLSGVAWKCHFSSCTAVHVRLLTRKARRPFCSVQNTVVKRMIINGGGSLSYHQWHRRIHPNRRDYKKSSDRLTLFWPDKNNEQGGYIRILRRGLFAVAL